MIDRIEIEQRLLHRLTGGLAPRELSEWARATLALAIAEGPTLFAPEEDILYDVLKRCAVEADPSFELTETEIRTLLRWVAFSGTRPEAISPGEGPFLVAFRARMVPARFFPVAGLCAKCGAAVRISPAMYPRARQTRGALVCLWCARALPGNVLDHV